MTFFLIFAIAIPLGFALLNGSGGSGHRTPPRPTPRPRGAIPVQRIREYAQRAEGADLNWLVSRLMKEGASEAQALKRGAEFRRLIAMLGAGIPVVLKHGPLDDAWHTALLFSRNYEAFCRLACGRMIHHTPGDAPTSGSAALTGIAYAAAFGAGAWADATELWPQADPEEVRKQKRRQRGSDKEDLDLPDLDGASDVLSWILLPDTGASTHTSHSSHHSNSSHDHGSSHSDGGSGHGCSGGGGGDGGGGGGDGGGGCGGGCGS